MTNCDIKDNSVNAEGIPMNRTSHKFDKPLDKNKILEYDDSSDSSLSTYITIPKTHVNHLTHTISANNMRMKGHTDDESHSNHTGLRRVAVVEDFFKIIYKVHVEMGGKRDKHAGQKRTYRAVSFSDI